eukprot:CAMPEP_0206016156 /NCGR_PEP_ID=MMETSP1464-20131121/22078_1 /ASSEMBLY_ACC=CAM_ASM_001124 /TAXON_ID=119497 /ORGANISM="Exanthemachrysis gayraliae, Strain RCC1523" /LENGTH=279 /DNA_ID=CAMNT_0053389963 /DNA_START=24 /DNA_END=864 /DNA_ORIENTATION=-
MISAGIAAAALRRSLPLRYVKPLQTGFPEDSDGAFVARAIGTHEHSLGEHAAEAARTEEVPDIGAVCQTLFAWNGAVSPHLAVEREGRGVSDERVVDATCKVLAAFARRAGPCAPPSAPLALVETAGGPLSPSASNTLQADTLRPLCLPALLVGDARLGGVSATLCALESLVLRGYEVPIIVVPDGPLSNREAIARHAASAERVVLGVPALPPMEDGPSAVPAWLNSAAPQLLAIVDGALEAMRAASGFARDGCESRVLPHPFTGTRKKGYTAIQSQSQ